MRSPTIIALLLLVATIASAHGITHTITRDQAVTITVTQYDGSPLAHAEAEVRAPDDDSPFLQGRTDARGRLVFLPDRSGDWRVTVLTSDGHGLDTVVHVDDLGVPAVPKDPSPNRTRRGLAGIAIIAVITMVLLRMLRGARK